MNTKLRILPIIIFFTFLQLITIQIYAQQGYPQKVIVGTVTDENGRPLSGVLIKVQGAASGIRTDADGNYTLPYSNSSQALWHGLLIISYPGYRTKLIRTLEHRNIDIKLTALSYEEKAIPLPSPVLKTNAGGIYTESSWDLDLLKYNFTRPPDNPDPPGDTFDPILNGKVAINSPVIGEYTIEAREDRSINTFGKDFSINGKHNQDTKVWIYRQTSFDDARLYDATMIGERPDYLVATIEAGEPYGMYLMWIENENGPGYPVRINAPLLTWIGPDHATPGSPVNLYGQNLSHNNGTQTSYVYLRRWGSGQGTASFPIQVTEINPYKVMAILPDSLKTNADYEVWLHNGHGGTYGWSGPMKLHIDESYPYKWNGKTISVKDYGAAGDGLTDDSKAIQAAIDAATDGNKIFFPGGKYRLVRTGLSCTKSLSFEGEGAGISVVLTDSAFTQTQMLYIKDFPAQIRDMKFVTSKPDGKGLRILVLVENPDKEKTVKGFIVDHCAFKTLAFGGNSMDVGYGINCLEVEYVNDISITHNEFITQVAITSFSCDEIYIKDNTLYGNWKVTHGNGNLLTSFPGHIRRMDLSNNFFQSVDHTGPVTDSAKVIVRAIVFQNWHGGRHDRIYIAGNTVDRAGNPWDNSGEIILMELPTEKKVYKATSVGMVTMTLNDTWQDNSLSRETIAIIKNTGLGQFRRIIANSGNQITIDRPWDIQPDMTSVVSINSSMDNTVIYNNTITGIPDYYDQESATSGIQFYGAAFNNVIAGNTFQDIHYGIYITGFAADPTSDAGNSTGSIGTLVTGNKVLNAVYGLEAITVMYPEVMPAKLPDEIPWS